VRHILDWFHLSTRMRPIEQVLTGLSARQFQDPVPVQAAQASIERIRHLLWHGRPDEADQEIVLLFGQGSKIAERNGVSVQESTNDLTRLCTELKGYVQNNRDAIVNYHRRYHGKRPISSSRAEGCIDEVANAGWARSSVCVGRPAVLIASRWSELRSWMAVSNHAVLFRWRHSQTNVFPLSSAPRRLGSQNFTEPRRNSGATIRFGLQFCRLEIRLQTGGSQEITQCLKQRGPKCRAVRPRPIP
jgi:hypothetical protein